MTWFDHLNNVPRSQSAAAKSESGQGQVSKSQSEIKLWKPKYEVEDLDWHYWQVPDSALESGHVIVTNSDDRSSSFHNFTMI